jgi:hypothetical protein
MGLGLPLQLVLGAATLAPAQQLLTDHARCDAAGALGPFAGSSAGQLQPLRRLADLSIHFIDYERLQVADIASLARLSALTSLALKQCDLCDADLGPLSSITRLQSLQLRECLVRLKSSKHSG